MNSYYISGSFSPDSERIATVIDTEMNSQSQNRDDIDEMDASQSELLESYIDNWAEEEPTTTLPQEIYDTLEYLRAQQQPPNANGARCQRQRNTVKSDTLSGISANLLTSLKNVSTVFEFLTIVFSLNLRGI